MWINGELLLLLQMFLNNAATVNVVTQIKNENPSSKNVVLKTNIYNADGKEISSRKI